MPEKFEIEIVSHTTPTKWTGGSFIRTAPLSQAIAESLDAFIGSELDQGRINPDRLIIVVTPHETEHP